MPEDSRKVAGGTFGGTGRERQAPAAGKGKTRPETKELMEGVLRQENLREALGRVRSNQGAPGVDGMSTEALVAYLRENWPRIREELAGGTYRPGPIRRVDIPKPDGKGVRSLGIPTVLDRFIQQAILQVLTPPPRKLPKIYPSGYPSFNETGPGLRLYFRTYYRRNIGLFNDLPQLFFTRICLWSINPLV